MELFDKRKIRNKKDIAKKKQREQKAKFLVKWKNYDTSEAIWEPKIHLINVQTALKQFQKTIKRGKCYDLNSTGKFAGNVCQNLSLAV